MTLAEIMVTSAVGFLLLTVMAVLYVFGMRTFGAMNNYAEMDAKSRIALDYMIKEIRQASTVLGQQTSGSTIWLKVANTNSAIASTNTFTWDSGSRALTWDKTAQGVAQPTKTLLTGCSAWNFTLYLRAPYSDGTFPTTSDITRTKLINMTWTCLRSNLVANINSESIVTAEVVLRNLQE
jgi:Tfp pilus assembly protein PilW